MVIKAFLRTLVLKGGLKGKCFEAEMENSHRQWMVRSKPDDT
jgi:hypothetical protein